MSVLLHLFLKSVVAFLVNSWSTISEDLPLSTERLSLISAVNEECAASMELPSLQEEINLDNIS